MNSCCCHHFLVASIVFLYYNVIMSKLDKLKQKFLAKSKNFTYNELKALLSGFGYHELKTGKTSGSRVAFINDKTLHVIRLHKPHPGNILKKYQLDFVEEELKSMEVVK